jgi:hypothetical protein
MVQGRHLQLRWCGRTWNRLIPLVASFTLYTIVGCRSTDCSSCQSRTGGRTPPHLASPTVGLPGTPTLPAANSPSAVQSRNSAAPVSQTRSDASAVNGSLGGSDASAANLTRPVSPSVPNTKANGSVSTASPVAPLPPPRDMSVSIPTNAVTGITPTSASSHWTPASTPATPPVPSLHDPGPLPPPPPGSVSNSPVLPPAPPPNNWMP